MKNRNDTSITKKLNRNWTNKETKKQYLINRRNDNNHGMESDRKRHANIFNEMGFSVLNKRHSNRTIDIKLMVFFNLCYCKIEKKKKKIIYAYKNPGGICIGMLYGKCKFSSSRRAVRRWIGKLIFKKRNNITTGNIYHCNVFRTKSTAKPQTCDGDLRGPFAGAVEHGLFHLRHVSEVSLFFDTEDRPKLRRDLDKVPIFHLSNLCATNFWHIHSVTIFANRFS